MTFTLKPDDNGIIVVLSNVDESDIAKLEAAEKKGFDPTDPPFDKYYAYDKRIGFYVDKDHFDHAEHKGKRLSFAEYMSMISDGEIIAADNAVDAADCLHKAIDAKFDARFCIDRILEIKAPKDIASAIASMTNLNFSLHQLSQSIDDADDGLKKDFHKALNHAFDIYDKANKILLDSQINELIKLAKALESYRNESSDMQSKLLQKYHENF